MHRPLRKILIVGGGSSGWLTAGFLRRALGDTVELTLIESSKVDVIGVGEATVPTIKSTMKFIGYEEDEWLPHVDGTFKAGIKFVDWVRNGNGATHQYFHPFWDLPEPTSNPYGDRWFPWFEGVDLFQYCLKRRLEGDRRPIVDMYLPLAATARAQKAPRSRQHPELNLNCAYHMDAGKLVTFLRERLLVQGVQHVIDHVEDVRLDEQGFIASIATRGGRTLDADLYIDCTGFRGVLINQALKVPFASDSEALLCNAAVAISARNDPAKNGIPPYATATALSHGWAWEIPLFTRDGCGYVYSDNHQSADAAEAELRGFLGPASDGMRANHIKMRIGRTTQPWHKNCVAIGLSSCFIEPLESTGIVLTEFGIATLLSLLPDRTFSPGRAKLYNQTVKTIYEQIRDFVVLHYVTARRSDTTFWRDVARQTKVPESLAVQLELFRDNLPVLQELQRSAFRSISYMSILDGCGQLPKAPYPLLEHIGYEAGERELAKAEARIDDLLERLPDHHAYVVDMRQRAGLV